MRFVTAKSGPEKATKTRQYDLLRPRVGQKEPPRPGSTICYGQEWARKSHQDRAVRFVTAKSGPERATKTRQYDLLRPTVGQKEPPRPGSTICYGQEQARKSHQDPAVRFVTAKTGPERATKTRQCGSTICNGRDSVRKSHQDPAVRFVTAKGGPERATKTRQYDLLRLRVGQKKPPRLGSTIRYGQEWARKSHQDPAVRFVTAKSGPERATKTRQYDLLRPIVGPERATKTRQYDLLRPRVGQKEPRPGSTICYSQDPAVRFVTANSGPRKSHQNPAVQVCYGQEWARKSDQDPAVRFVTAKSGPKGASTICYGQEWARKSHQDPAVRFVTAKNGPERANKTRQYDLSRPRVSGSTICYGQEWARKSHQDPAVRFVTAKSGTERATKTRQYDLLRPRVGQKEPPRPGNTICYGQEWD